MTLDRTPRWLPFLLGVLLMGGHQLRSWPWTLDDAFITFRYAENLAAGLGPVFNPGEQVEGYTNFLWMLLLAGAHSLGLDTVVAAKALGAAFTLATLGGLCFIDRVVPGLHRHHALLAVLFAGSSPIVTRWSMSGMEVALLTFLLTATAALHLRDRPDPRPLRAAGLGLLCALAAMTRPDAGLLFGVLALDRLWRRQPLLALGAFVGAFGLAYGGYFAWRYDYYGWLLPNTFYVKVGSSGAQAIRGLFYTLNFALVCWLMGLAGPAALLVPRLRRGMPAGLLVIAALVSLHTLYVVAVGGDVMYGYRFFAAYIPLMALVTVGAWEALEPARWPRRVLPWAVVGLNLFWLAASGQLNYRGSVARQGARVGRWLAEHAPPDALLAVNVAGTIPYYSGLRTIDTLGLNDEHIAHREIESMGAGWAGHEKGDGAYVLAREPDYVIFSSSAGSKKPRFVGDIELFELAEFHQAYDLHVYFIDERSRLTVWVRRPDHGGAGLDVTANSVTEGDLRFTLSPEEVEATPARSWKPWE